MKLALPESPWAGGPPKAFTLHDGMVVSAPFKTRSLRFEWETANPTHPLITKNAMNGTGHGFFSIDPIDPIFTEFDRSTRLRRRIHSKSLADTDFCLH